MATENTPAARTRLGQVINEEQGRRHVWLAGKIDVSPASLSRYVNGLHVPDDKRALLAATLGRNESDLFDENGQHLPPLTTGAAA